MMAVAITEKWPSPPRMGVAVANLLAHALFLQILFTARQSSSLSEPLAPALTWLRLKPVSAPVMPTVPASADSEPAPVLALPRVTTPRLPALSPSQDAITQALDVYVSCALPDDNRLWTEDQRRCAQRLWDSYTSAPPQELSAREQALLRKFERDLKIQNAPVLLPCFSPVGGISPACVIQGFSQGFEANAGYAETDIRNTHVHGMPRPPRLPGMRSGLP